MSDSTLAGLTQVGIPPRLLCRWPAVLGALAACVLSIGKPAYAQEPTWRWASHSTENGNVVVAKVATDAAGNSYVTGRFTHHLQLGSYSLQSVGSSDVFAAKLSASGEWQWATAAGGAGTDMASGLVVDADGNVTVAGSFTESASFGSFTKRSQGGHDMFVASLTPAGTWRAVSTAGGTEQDQITAIALDAQHNVVVGGRFRGEVSFETNTLSSTATSDAFVAKLDDQGRWVWARQTQGSDQTVINSLTIGHAGDIYTAGYFAGTTHLGPAQLTSAGTHDAFVAKVDGAGNWQWATTGGGPSTDYAKAIAVSADGNVFVTGSFSGRASFGAFDFLSQGGDDAYVARLTPQGQWQWVYTVRGNAMEDATDVCLGPGGSIYITGCFSRGAQYGTSTLVSQGSTDLFMARLSKSGRWLDFLTFGSLATDDAGTIRTAPNGDVYVGGILGSAARLGAFSTGNALNQLFVGRVEFPVRMTADIR
ncbi:NHL repeat-containing protein [Hymenobacter mucosus]|uniref:Beta-propeller repeat-containing protein n=1 Tax=Hymenobacter mucosus TaxID=1411120 RepID=A0A238Z8V5_9BACT|nr:hypothetical protein [Hymenobacter mucosus]SNR79562.1 hypothetical protein SAMN06269173_10719 [Hymenobacter mucosus]